VLVVERACHGQIFVEDQSEIICFLNRCWVVMVSLAFKKALTENFPTPAQVSAPMPMLQLAFRAVSKTRA
jgi:hypothetical protein